MFFAFIMTVLVIAALVNITNAYGGIEL